MSDHHSESSTGQPPVNLTRRRLARGATAAPVVLGAMVSPPVLGGSAAPYHCTISGQQSARASVATVGTCNTGGKSPATWCGLNWPTSNNSGGKNYGKAIPKRESGARDKRNSCVGAGGTEFKAIFEFDDVFRIYGTREDPKKKNGKYSSYRVVHVVGSGAGPVNKGNQVEDDLASASCLEVMSLTGTNPQLTLCKEAVAALLNSLNNSAYPLFPEEVIAMFEFAKKNQAYQPPIAGSKPIDVLAFWQRSRA